eukprot:gene14498-19464_t
MEEINIRRFNQFDQESVVKLFSDGLLSYSTEGPHIAACMEWYVNSKLDPTKGDMIDIEKNYFSANNNEGIKDTYFWVAEKESVVVGCVACIPSTEYDQNTHLELVRMSVSSEYRGFGIASKLITTLENHAQSLGKSFIHLTTLIVQQPAVKLYLKNGFSITKEVPLDLSKILGGEPDSVPMTAVVHMMKKI